MADQLVSGSRYFGADLQRCRSAAPVVAMLVVVVAVNVVDCCWYPVERFPANVAEWCRFLRRCTRVASAILFQLAFVYVVVFQWKSLWSKVQQVEQFIICPGGSFGGKVRRPLVAVSTAVIAVVGKLATQLIQI